MKYLFVSSLSDIPPLASTCPNRRNEIGGTPPNPADGNDCIAFASSFLSHTSRSTIKGETANCCRIQLPFRTGNTITELSVFKASPRYNYPIPPHATLHCYELTI